MFAFDNNLVIIYIVLFWFFDHLFFLNISFYLIWPLSLLFVYKQAALSHIIFILTLWY